MHDHTTNVKRFIKKWIGSVVDTCRRPIPGSWGTDLSSPDPLFAVLPSHLSTPQPQSVREGVLPDPFKRHEKVGVREVDVLSLLLCWTKLFQQQKCQEEYHESCINESFFYHKHIHDDKNNTDNNKIRWDVPTLLISATTIFTTCVTGLVSSTIKTSPFRL